MVTHDTLNHSLLIHFEMHEVACKFTLSCPKVRTSSASLLSAQKKQLGHAGILAFQFLKFTASIANTSDNGELAERILKIFTCTVTIKEHCSNAYQCFSMEIITSYNGKTLNL